jgi:hypothetical protein
MVTCCSALATAIRTIRLYRQSHFLRLLLLLMLLYGELQAFSICVQYLWLVVCVLVAVQLRRAAPRGMNFENALPENPLGA